MFCRKGGNKYKHFEQVDISKIKDVSTKDSQPKTNIDPNFNPNVNVLDFSLKHSNGKNDYLFQITHAREVYQFEKAKYKLKHLMVLPKSNNKN